jgi:hypothetical protein
MCATIDDDSLVSAGKAGVLSAFRDEKPGSRLKSASECVGVSRWGLVVPSRDCGVSRSSERGRLKLMSRSVLFRLVPCLRLFKMPMPRATMLRRRREASGL